MPAHGDKPALETADFLASEIDNRALHGLPPGIERTTRDAAKHVRSQEAFARFGRPDDKGQSPAGRIPSISQIGSAEIVTSSSGIG